MSYLIRQCDVPGRPTILDVLVEQGRITGIGESLEAPAGTRIINAAGSALLPSLRDHHIHLLSLAASLDSVHCGPPAVSSEEQLATVLARENHHSRNRWLRGIGYHNSVAGNIDRHWLDRWLPDRPARIQHRGGRLWVLNSAALEDIGLFSQGHFPSGIEYIDDQPSGRLYECDQWLRLQLGNAFPDLENASSVLASYGISHITDTTPSNDPTIWRHFTNAQREGQLKQHVRMMGSLPLATAIDSPAPNDPGLSLGEFKVHLLESRLPDIDTLCADMHTAHEQGRAVAVHCVTLTELVFTLACFETVGVMPGDRIEHAAVTPPFQLQKIAELGLRVVTQPHFIPERGDQYLEEVATTEQPWLYRLRAFLDAGVPLAAGSDAAFGGANPWLAMAAATSRKTRSGTIIGASEALTAEQALALYTSELQTPGIGIAALAPGMPANLCLLQQCWQDATRDLAGVQVVATWRGGTLIHNSIDKAPVQGGAAVDLSTA